MLCKKYGSLYAVDMVLLAENMEELQDLLDKLHVCCSRGSLTSQAVFTKLKKKNKLWTRQGKHLLVTYRLSFETF